MNEPTLSGPVSCRFYLLLREGVLWIIRWGMCSSPRSGFFIWVMWIFLLIRIATDIFRSKDIGGWAKAGSSLYS